MPSICYELLTTNAFELLRVTCDKCHRVVTSYLRQMPSSCYELLTTIAFVRAIIAVLWTIASLRFQITLPSTRASQFRRWARDTIYKQSQMQISERQVPKRGKNAAETEIREGLKRGCAEMRQRLKRGNNKNLTETGTFRMISYFCPLTLSPLEGPYGPMTNNGKDDFSGGLSTKYCKCSLAVFIEVI